jgi:hypothetical protein
MGSVGDRECGGWGEWEIGRQYSLARFEVILV